MHRTTSFTFGLPAKFGESGTTVNSSNNSHTTGGGGFGLSRSSSWTFTNTRLDSTAGSNANSSSSYAFGKPPPSGVRKPLEVISLNQQDQSQQQQPQQQPLTNGSFGLAPSSATLRNGQTPPQQYASATSSAATTPSVGSSTGRVQQGDLQDQHFERQSILGRGASATVYDAIHIPSNTRVALKEISKDYIKARSHQGYGVALREEINLHRPLKHPNIVRLYSYFSTRDSVVLVMEPCLEGTLYDYLQKYSHDHNGGCASATSSFTSANSNGCSQFSDGPRLPSGLPLREVRRILRQTAHALHHLHAECGVVHRDLKLENLLMHADGQIRLADFGWARRLRDLSQPGTTQMPSEITTTEGRLSRTPSMNGLPQQEQQSLRESQRLTICGTLDYMAPEIMSELLAQHEAATDEQSREETHVRHRQQTASAHSSVRQPSVAATEWNSNSLAGISSIYAPGQQEKEEGEQGPRGSFDFSQGRLSAAAVPPNPRMSTGPHDRSDVEATRGSSRLNNFSTSPAPPEPAQYSAATDTWSFGCIAHELIFGQPPFYRRDKKATAYAIIQDEPGFTNHPSYIRQSRQVEGHQTGGEDGDDDAVPAPSLSPWRNPSSSPQQQQHQTADDVLPPEAIEVLAHCLAKNPADRPSAQQLLHHPFLQR